MFNATKTIVFLSILAFFFIVTADVKAYQNPWDYTNMYAPVVYFFPQIQHYPMPFENDPAANGTCSYVNVFEYSGDYIFQYWFYYRKDIRLDENSDAAIHAALKMVVAYLERSEFYNAANLLNDNIKYLFHEHDWELVEVVVPNLGSAPRTVNYFAHSMALPVEAKWVIFEQRSGYQPSVAVWTDMHACYPGMSSWHPHIYWPENLKARAECILAEGKLGSLALIGENELTKVDYSGKLVYFNKYVTQHTTYDFPRYPYRFPWEKSYDYMRK